MDHLTFVNEVASILRGEHPGWRGDRITNAEFILWTTKRDFPEDAMALASDIRANLGEYSELTGLSPDRLCWISNRLEHNSTTTPEN